MVYITSGPGFGRTGKLLWTAAGVFLFLFFLAAILWEILHGRFSGAVFGLIAFHLAGYPLLRIISRQLLQEDISIDTRSLTVQRSFGFFQGKKFTYGYRNGELATGAIPFTKKETQLRVSWFTEGAKSREPKLLYQHVLPMTSADYQKTTEYVQELFDLEGGDDHFQLLFSAN